MKILVATLLTICLCGTRGEYDSDCTPGATLAHSHDCSKYYICDADNHLSTFECSSGLFYNPETANCEPAEKVTCFGPEKKDEKTTSVEINDGEDYRENVKDINVTKTKRQDKEPEQHKGFYFLENSSDESSKSGETDKEDSSNQGGIVINARAFSPNPGHSEESRFVSVKSKSSERKEKIGETEKGKIEIHQLDLTDAETREEVRESEEIEDGVPRTGDDTVDTNEDIKERLKKREYSVNNTMSTINETNKEEKTEDAEDKVENEKSGSGLHSEALSVAGPSTSFTNDVTYQLTNVNDTNVLRFGSLPEPVANWTESLHNGWIDLLIFWKHPVDENFKGSVFFHYPSSSMSDKSGIKDLVLEILQLAEKPEGSDSNETIAEDNPEVFNPQQTSEKGTQTT